MVNHSFLEELQKYKIFQTCYCCNFLKVRNLEEYIKSNEEFIEKLFFSNECD